MRKKIIVTSTGIALAAAAGIVVGTGVASAGHTNTVLETTLDGREEVAANAQSKKNAGDPNGTGEAYVFGIDNDAKTLCYVLTVDKIDVATAAHIHRGAAGTNGPVVANLAAPADGNAADCLTDGESGKFLNGGTVAEILANPANFYVNVHNAEFPGGAIRGQLAPQD